MAHQHPFIRHEEQYITSAQIRLVHSAEPADMALTDKRVHTLAIRGNIDVALTLKGMFNHMESFHTNWHGGLS